MEVEEVKGAASASRLNIWPSPDDSQSTAFVSQAERNRQLRLQGKKKIKYYYFIVDTHNSKNFPNLNFPLFIKRELVTIP